jgi:hypothetical protein
MNGLREDLLMSSVIEVPWAAITGYSRRKKKFKLRDSAHHLYLTPNQTSKFKITRNGGL